MLIRKCSPVLALLWMPAFGQEASHLAAVRQSVAANREKLHAYQWLETTEVLIKGELKNRRQAECRFDASGTVARTPVGAPAEAGKPRGLRGKIAAGKIEEMHEYTERLGGLVERYAPPDPQKLQAAAKVASSSPGDLVIEDYAKPGDRVTFSFDPNSKKLRSYNVATYLDGQQDVVTMNVTFTPLPDGTNAVSQTEIASQEKHLQIRRTNSSFNKTGR